MSTVVSTGSVVALAGDGGHSREEIGGKAWSIQQMLGLGIPVPPAFVVTTDVCRAYHRAGGTLPDEIWQEVVAAVAGIEQAVDRCFGGERPLLVSVRSGASTSMPGMMDTVLNLGINAASQERLAQETGSTAYAADTRVRFEEQFAKVVGAPAPEDPWEQLYLAVCAVLESWFSKRAIAYRAARGIPDDGGTAVTVQAMVFGNLDDDSGTGVLFSRDPLTGGGSVYGEWLARGQGEDVVSGRADALPLDTLAQAQPQVHAELMEATRTLEREGRDVMDIEFTVQSGTLWLLQSRPAKRAPEAAVRSAIHLAEAGVIDRDEAIARIRPDDVRALLRPRLAAADVAASPAVATGKPACPGIAVGVVVTDADEAEDRADDGESVVLVRPTTDPDDVAGMAASVAVVTEIGGSTSHAAVVCRELGLPCVVGTGTDTLMALAGQVVTVDGGSGTVHLGALAVEPAATADDPALATLREWLGIEDSDPASVVARLAAGAPGTSTSEEGR
ncbi:pyruvate phosphate dikinase [Nocardioides sp. Root190]|uniref:pyruvate, phosphate dikinase n=1 Tax=Nocardioides sp. Root190 TaxID=1736488 RepID=UPI0006FEBEB4|nr:pyruvate, phosphate dikinase [Nocardioides sp. Root190]KRB80429.1 pyruvate phosphate dikinase [Nocardioides sp. Root190]